MKTFELLVLYKLFEMAEVDVFFVSLDVIEDPAGIFDNIVIVIFDIT